MANLISNSDLTCAYNTTKKIYTIYNWYHESVKVNPRTYSSGVVITENESQFHDNYASPGIYQYLDLFEYTGFNHSGKTVNLEVSFQAGYSPDYTASDMEFYVYLYKARGGNQIQNGVDGGFANPVYKQKIVLPYEPNYEYYRSFIVNIDFIPERNSYYFIGFGADGIVYNNKEHKVATESIVGLWLNNIEVELSELDVDGVPYSNLLDNVLTPSDYSILKTTKEESGVTGGCFITSYSLGTALSRKVGLISRFTVPELDNPNSIERYSEYEAVFSFWYRSDLPEGCEFIVYLYDAVGNEWIEETLTTKNDWTFYSVYLDFVFAEDFRLLIIPPTETYGSHKFYFKDESFNIFIKNNIEEAGTFDNPYSTDNGYFIWDDDKSPTFKIYPGTYPSYPQEDSFIHMERFERSYNEVKKLENNYYMTKDTSGNLYTNGLHEFIDENGHEYYRYFDSNGCLAIDKKFIHDNVYYIADKEGKTVLESSVLNDLSLHVEGYDNTVKVVDVLEGETLTLHATFNKMYPATKLDIEYDDSIISIVGIDINPQEDDYGGYKTSNTSNDITIIGKKYGQTAITLSHKNFDGSITKQSILVHVCDDAEYSDDIFLEIPYEVNYIGLHGALQLKCLIRPQMSYNIPIDWFSSDESIAKVDAFGNITPISIGVCTITAINYKSKKTASCTLHVIEKTDIPSYITLSPESVSLGINDTSQIKALAYDTWTNTYENVCQSFIWSSEDNSIATIDEFGYVKGINNGTTRVMCRHTYNPIVKFATITVTGESVSIQGIELNIQKIMFMVQDSSAYEYLKPSFYPSNTSQLDIVWVSDNEDVAMVDQNGKIYPNPNFNNPNGGNNIARIKCISVANSNIYDTCEVTIVEPKDYVPTVYFTPKSIKTYQDQTAITQCGISRSSYITDKTITVSVSKKDGSATINDISLNKKGDVFYISLDCDEIGEFIVTARCDYVNSKVSTTKKYTTATYEVIVLENNLAPVIVRDLKVENAYYNGSYVLSYYVEDDIDLYLKHVINIDGEDSDLGTEKLLYNGENYYYIFGKNLKAGEHKVYITATDSSNASTSSGLVSFIIPEIAANKVTLSDAKVIYDAHTTDIIEYLHHLIGDENISIVEKKEFDARYYTWDYAYENFRAVLNLCVEHIKDEIEASQASIAAIASGLASDGTSVATYSEGDYTNSNYQTVTDMDYYQNECIKELTNRVLQLEALIQQLISNNNN